MADALRLARADELGAVFALRARAFERGTPGEWAAFVEHDPWRDAGADLVAVADGQVVATLRLLARRIAGVDGDLRLAGIGAVASDPAVRGRGYIRRLLALAHERNRTAGYDLALLFTGSPWVYSGSAGFETLSTWWLDLDVQRAPAPARAWAIAPVEPSRHLPAMRQVYEQFGQGRPGYPVRGDAYWTHPARLSDPSWTRLALDQHGDVAAYLRVRLSADGPARILECPYVTADAVLALVAELRQDRSLSTSTPSTLSGRLPHDHVLGRTGQWSIRDETMVHPYTTAGGQLIDLLRNPSHDRAVYWHADGF